MTIWRLMCFLVAAVSVLSGCVREEEALTDNPSGPIGGGNPPPTSEALSIAAPAAMQSEATGVTTTVDLGQATPAGGDGAYTTSNDAPAGGFVLGTTVVTWTVVDGAGAQASATQNVDIADTTAPILVKPADMQVQAAGAMTMVDIGTATATDLVDQAPVIDNDMSPNGFPIGTTGVQWTATDASGNTATAMQMITVTQPSAGPLVITAPADISSEATAVLSNVMLGAATVTGGAPPMTIENDAPAAGYSVGATTITWTVTDSAAMTAMATQVVTITDTTAPTIVAPANVTADQASGVANTMVDLGNATVSDIADPNPVVSNDAPAGGFPVGTSSVLWTVQDAAGNTATATQTVTVNAFVAEQCSDLQNEFETTIFAIMDSANPLTCNGCHTGPATLPTPNGFAFANDPPTAADFDIFRTVASIDSNGQSLVSVKARGGASHSGGDRFPDGDSDPDWVTFSAFVDRSAACIPNTTSSTAKVMLGTGYEQLHRTVSALGSRTPTTDEINLVAAAGTDQAAIDASLDAVIDGLMNEEAFFTRIVEIYNDLLLTDKDIDDRGSVENNFDIDAFANRDYFEDNFSGGTRSDLREAANYGFGRAPLELIKYVIANDRPFTEILTADYVMVNPYSAVILNVDAGDTSFPFTATGNMDNHDVDDFRPVSALQQSDGTSVPIAGVISTHAFLARYPSTNTNVNRKRASFLFDYFLGVSIEGLAPRDGLDLDNVIGTVPTYEDPQCTVCHEVMDPIAGLFTKRDNDGEYDDGNQFQHNRTTGGVPRMVPAGYSLDPADVLPASEELQPLKWLSGRLAADDRFADRTVRTVFRGLTRIEPTLASTNAYINTLKTDFVSSNFDFKELVKDIVSSEYFKARNLDAGENANEYADIGPGRLLTSEELNRRVTAVTGGNYSWRGPNSNSGLMGRHYLLYGGIDSDDVIIRTTAPTALMDGIQERIANQVSCERIANDLYNGGTLFPFVDEANTPDNGGETAIRQNIQFLHRHLLGEDVAVDSAVVDQTYQLFVDARALGETSVPSQCRGGGPSTDANGTVLPWMAVATFLMTDYRFVYE